MRIDAYNQIGQIYKANNKGKVQAANKTKKSDQLEISSFGRDLQIAKQAVKESPDVREDRVKELKAKIDNGTYEVSNEAFADKLMEKFYG